LVFLASLYFLQVVLVKLILKIVDVRKLLNIDIVEALEL